MKLGKFDEDEFETVDRVVGQIMLFPQHKPRNHRVEILKHLKISNRERNHGIE